MTLEIKIPEISEGISEGVVVAISVAVGDRVEEDQAMLEFETEKAVVEIPSMYAGRIVELRVAEGETVKTGDVIILMETDETVPAEQTAGVSEPEEQSVATVESEEPVSATGESQDAGESEQPPAPPADSIAPAAPATRRKARELGVNINQVAGSGPGGRISKADVRSHVRQSMQQSESGESTGPVSRPLPDFSRWGPIKTEPLSQVRQVTAETMSHAWSTIPMVAQTGQARISAFENFRKEFNSQADRQTRLTMTALLVKICAAALRQFPQFNSSLDQANRQLILKDYVHIGVAVDTPSGLLVPVLRDADRMDVETLALELNELAVRARERKLSPEEMEGGSFTISNLGSIGRDPFTPIVYTPQVAILGVARGRHEPVWNGQDFAPELVLPLTLTYDHRVIDGADGARFMQWICQAIEYPLQLVMKG